ncbi:hypothetical protein M3Y99_00894900 [Aphelenchoides fujianensis]|nr:hypothetical protein M3Y99_00894900 [Aphelenchoides fujianensis]
MSEADKAGFWDRQWHPISAYATKIGRWISEGKTRDGRADLTNFELGLLDTRVGPYSSNEKEIPLGCLANPYVKPACLPISLIAGFFMIIFLAPLFSEEYEMSLRFEKTGVCTEPCALQIVESIPTNLTFASAVNHTRTHEAWADLLRSAKKSVRIAALYWTLHHHIYVGSANMDWRSLTEVKELGVVVRNCSCMAIDLQKVFAIYWKVADSNELMREPWHLNLRPAFNHAHPLNISFNGVPMRTFISSSPAPLNAKGRDHDADAIIYVISQAREYVRVAVMDYFPATLYMGEERNYYWGLLDDALRGAAFRGARVDLLISQWNYRRVVSTRPEMLGYLRSMLTINNVLPFHVGGRRGEINVRLFTVPTSPEQRQIDHGRVNHNKYMVTEKMAYVGTSNWAADYFITTAGVGVIFETVENPTIVSEFNAVFERDWTSNYTQQLTSSVDV